MNKFLRGFRIVFATLFFTVMMLGFLEFSGGNEISRLALRTQFIPAVVHIFSGSALAFIFLVILTLLFGRVYCSFLCPLGILQDIITRISNFFRKRANGGKLPRTSYKKPHNILRYSILVIIAIFVVCGIIYPLVLLDPYSNFGKIAGQLFVSVETAIVNLLAGIFPTIFYKQEYVRLSLYSFIYSSFFFIVIAIFSAFKGRLYCNTICPVGTFLGLLSGYSLFKPVIDKDMCVRCNLCAGNCKSNCINLQTKEIDVTRCVACYNCLTNCKRGGVKLVPTWFKKRKKGEAEHREIENIERRNALIAMGGFATALAAAAARKYTFTNKLSAQSVTPVANEPILPPGSGNLTAFMDACTACHACIAACPNEIIKPASFEYGLEGIMLPTLSFEDGHCSYDCNVCSQTCPHGAIQHITLEEKQQTQIGVAYYLSENCVINIDGVNCGACARACPTKAISMVPLRDGSAMRNPAVNPSICIGCGACENACPGVPKAIVVSGKENQTKIG